MADNNVKDLFGSINRLKAEKNAVVLSHYYMPPELRLPVEEGGVADFTGDSLGLSMEAQRTTADHILFCGVRFMAETVVLINQQRRVFMPEPESGCSLAASISADDVRALRKKHPGIPVMAYINTYADTKAEADICCTSRNALAIAGSLDSDRIIFVPDLYMGQNLRAGVRATYGKELILWNGTCEVHEQFRNDMLTGEPENGMEVLMHWEVPGDMVASQLKHRKGIVGSTGDIIQYVKQSKAERFFVASECDLGDVLKGMNREKEFITPCIKCPHMKQNTLDKLHSALEAIGTDTDCNYEITLDLELIRRARVPVLRMLNYN